MKKIISKLLTFCLCLTFGILLSACYAGDEGTASKASLWHTGSGAPSASVTAEINDMYLDTNTADIYQLTSSGWKKVTNIKPADGQDGKDGKDGANGTNGTNGQNGQNGKDGEDGKDVIVKKIALNAIGQLVVTYEDGHTVTLDVPKLNVTCEHKHYTNTEINNYKHSCDTATNAVTNGMCVFKCTDCGWTEIYEGAIHNYKTEAVGDCRDANPTSKTYCLDCGYVESNVAVAGHVCEKETVEPTCTVDGYTITACKYCDYEDESTKVVNTGTATGHEGKWIYAFDKGKTICEDGGYHIKRCAVCDEFLEQTTVEPTHIVAVVEDENDPMITNIGWKVKEAPTETQTGKATGICYYCSKEITVDLPKLSSEDYTVRNDCVKENKTTYTIYVTETCKTSKTEITDINTWELTFKSGTVLHTLNGVAMDKDKYLTGTPGIEEFANNPASCSKDGAGVYVCDICKAHIKVTLYEEHEWDEENLTNITPPDCDTDGTAFATCKWCTETKNDYIIPKLNHKFTYSIEITDKGDGTFEAKLIGTCTNVIEGVACTHSEEITDKTVTLEKSKDATCEEKGYVYYVCDLGDDVVIENIKYIDPLGHSDTGEAWTWTNEGVTYEGYYCEKCGWKVITKTTQN